MAERKRKSNLVSLLAIAGGVVLFLNRDDPGGGGGTPGGTVQTSGTFGAIGVSQSVPANAPNVVKLPGDLLVVDVDFGLQASDIFGPLTVPWPFRLEMRVGHNTIGGWRTIGESFPGGNETGVRFFELSRIPGSYSQNMAFTVPDDVGVTYDVRGRLFAAVSDDQGVPIPDSQDPAGFQFFQIAAGELVGALDIGSNVVSPGGSIGTISVSQVGVK